MSLYQWCEENEGRRLTEEKTTLNKKILISGQDRVEPDPVEIAGTTRKPLREAYALLYSYALLNDKEMAEECYAGLRQYDKLAAVHGIAEAEKELWKKIRVSGLFGSTSLIDGRTD